MDKEYWDNYYRKGIVEKTPSRFAEYVLKEHLKKDKKLVELGCGNGRDSIYFARNNIHVLSIDGSESAINILKTQNELSNIEFVNDNFVTTSYLDEKYNYVYSRFTLHAISDDEQKQVIKRAYNALLKDGLLLVEVRSVNDELYGLGKKVGRNAFFYNDHYRRFLKIDEFMEQLEHTGFEILYSAEQRNFAPHGQENPPIIRVIAKK